MSKLSYRHLDKKSPSQEMNHFPKISMMTANLNMDEVLVMSIYDRPWRSPSKNCTNSVEADLHTIVEVTQMSCTGRSKSSPNNAIRVFT